MTITIQRIPPVEVHRPIDYVIVKDDTNDSLRVQTFGSHRVEITTVRDNQALTHRFHLTKDEARELGQALIELADR